MGKKKKKNSGLLAVGLFVLLIAVVLTIFVLSPEIKLQELATVSAGPITVSGLSEENAMWLGGVAIIAYILGPIMIAKSR